MKSMAAFAIGLVFGAGLLFSGMTDPGKVIGFLDVFGAWDPSLAFVMVGAVLVGLFGFAAARRRTQAVLGGAMHLPRTTNIDRRLVAGSTIFGVGWGLAGFCPGPALVAAAAGYAGALVFVVSMLAGMALQSWLDRRPVIAPPPSRTPDTRADAPRAR
jgi:uncharacterized membrane protein YedE/YeeE